VHKEIVKEGPRQCTNAIHPRRWVVTLRCYRWRSSLGEATARDSGSELKVETLVEAGDNTKDNGLPGVAVGTAI
jgi:hypothetical protein